MILYNLGVGATEKELQWKFEGNDQFIVPQFPWSAGFPLDQWLPNFNPAHLRSSSTLHQPPF